MSSAGHVMDMNNRIKQNRALLTFRRERRRKLRHMYVMGLKSEGVVSDRDKFHPDVVARVKESIRQQIRREKRKEIIIAAILCLLFIAIAVILYRIS